MSLYGDLYTNLTTFFHKFRFKGSLDNNKVFPENPLEDNIDLSPEIAYSTLSLGSGNRWIKMQQEEEGSGINIYHAAPEGKDIEDISITENIISVVSKEDANDPVSLYNGGYLKLYNNTFDEAGHLKDSEEKYFSFPDYTTLETQVDTNKKDIVILKTQIGTAETEISSLWKQLEDDGTIMTQLAAAEQNAANAIKDVNEITPRVKNLEDTVNHKDSGVSKLNTRVEEIEESMGSKPEPTTNTLWDLVNDYQDQIYNGSESRIENTGTAIVEMLAILESMISDLSEIAGSKELYLSALKDAKDAAKDAGWTVEDGGVA